MDKKQKSFPLPSFLLYLLPCLLFYFLACLLVNLFYFFFILMIVRSNFVSAISSTWSTISDRCRVTYLRPSSAAHLCWLYIEIYQRSLGNDAGFYLCIGGIKYLQCSISIFKCFTENYCRLERFMRAVFQSVTFFCLLFVIMKL